MIDILIFYLFWPIALVGIAWFFYAGYGWKRIKYTALTALTSLIPLVIAIGVVMVALQDFIKHDKVEHGTKEEQE